MPDELRGQLVVRPGSSVRLAEHDPAATFGHEKETAKAKVAADLERASSRAYCGGCAYATPS